MELLNTDIFVAFPALAELSQKDLPVKVSFGLAKMSIAMSEHYKAVEQIRNGLVQKYGKTDKDRPNHCEVKSDSENYPKFAEEITELMAQKVEVDFEKVKLPVEVDGKPFQVKAQLLVALDKFIESG